MLGLIALLEAGMIFRKWGPIAKTLGIVTATIIFFFLNVAIIYVYVQNEVNVQPLSMNEYSFEEKSFIHADNPNVCVLNGKNKLATSALTRVQTSECRRRLQEAACRLQKVAFHETMPLTGCHNYDSKMASVRMGCYMDKTTNRQLKGHEYVFDDNTPAKCESHCYRAGYLYYGLEFSKECFCGDEFDTSMVVENEKCSTHLCTGNVSQSCGGFEAIEIFRTGLIIKAAARVRKPTYAEVRNDKPKDNIKIMFLLQLNGRNVRQVRRLFKAIYSPTHLYYIHVDQRQLYMLNEMRSLAARLSNVFVQPDGKSTIWGGASLLSMVHTAVERSMAMSDFSSWDYLVNLSESDFPILTLKEFETQLIANRGNSFLASHGYDTARFIQKQGFDFVFVECEERMWRIGKRDEFPRGLRIDGGSDWIILHKDFAKFSISDDELPTKLRKLFSSIILPVESFFHTLAANSIFCNSVIAGNLRLTNWNRKQGCRCAALKKVVDWCGCSPLVFQKDTIYKFELSRAKDKSQYFARKFENLIDIDAIAAAEAQAMRDRPHLLSTNTLSFNTSHINFYEASVDGYSTPFSRFSRSLLSMSSLSTLKFGSVQSIHVYKEHAEDVYKTVFTIRPESSDYIEILVERITVAEIFPHASVNGFQLASIQMGVDIDHKEEIFRGYIGYADHSSAPTILLKWSRVPSIVTTIPNNKTSPEIKFEWRDQKDTLVATQTLHPYDSQFNSQFANLELPKLKNLQPNQTGRWSVDVLEKAGNQKIARIEFPIFDPSNQEQFDRYVPQFYRIKDTCNNDCEQKLWSTIHSDPKSEISYYNLEKEYLV